MRTEETDRGRGAMMLFGILPIMAEQAGIKNEAPIRQDYEYWDGEIKSIHDLLRSPMTLAQGAAIMNEYRAKFKGEEEEQDA